ncbi:putative acetyltransferase protein [Neofusicoccum parvum UCRNP2]|uniref:Putative acetyltransferase protein n=1 Tax=Botryosphaeria parva (strain UCR-NP2) TaxID=1287680 RepID=R1GYX3_BOTPV|nr:putative acetyltransferase protein [Neofusicoccum parvum UCRNP2]
MVRHVVPINTIRNSIHHANAAPPTSNPSISQPPPAFGEHRRGSSIPGSRTAAAFLTSLSANLTLPDVDSPFPSPISTPSSMRGSSDAHISHLPPPSPLASAMAMSADEYGSDAVGPTDLLSPSSLGAAPAAKQQQQQAASQVRQRRHQEAGGGGQLLFQPIPAAAAAAAQQPQRQAAADALAGVPELETEAATGDEDKVAALKLVADSVAQQRQAASWAVLSHPGVLAGYVLALAALHHYMHRAPGDLPVVLTTAAGVTMALLVAVRLATSGYIHHAESVNWSFLDEAADSVIVTRFGGQVIGALVLGWAGPSSTGNKAARRRKGRGVIKAWTVKLRYRGKGVGTGLLEEAVKETVRRGGEGVEFAEDHANSRRFLPAYFNGFLDRREDRAHDALQDVVNASGAFNGRRRKSSVY